MTASVASDPSLIAEGTKAASYVKFMERPLLELSHDELIAAAGFLFIELCAANEELNRLQTAIDAADLRVVDVELEDETPQEGILLDVLKDQLD